MAHKEDPSKPGGAHEHREANVRIVVETLIGLGISVTVVCFIVWGVFNIFKTTTPGGPRLSANASPAQLPPVPRLQVQTTEELKDLRAHEDDTLNHYRWVDHQAGIVHIPIQKAMEDVVKTLPTRPPGTEPAAAGPGQPKTARAQGGLNVASR